MSFAPAGRNTKVHGRKHAIGYVPRPRNAFFMFYADFVEKGTLPKSVESNHRNIRRIIGYIWAAMNVTEKAPWVQMADDAKREHLLLYPAPVKINSKRSARSRTKKKDAGSQCFLDTFCSVLDFSAPIDPPSVSNSPRAPIARSNVDSQCFQDTFCSVLDFSTPINSSRVANPPRSPNCDLEISLQPTNPIELMNYSYKEPPFSPIITRSHSCDSEMSLGPTSSIIEPIDYPYEPPYNAPHSPRSQSYEFGTSCWPNGSPNQFLSYNDIWPNAPLDVFIPVHQIQSFDVSYGTMYNQFKSTFPPELSYICESVNYAINSEDLHKSDEDFNLMWNAYINHNYYSE